MSLALVLAAALSGVSSAPAPAPVEEQGRVVLKCTLNADGSAHPCAIQSETPPGLGLGERALELIKQTRINPARGAGVVLVPMTFPIVDVEPGATGASPPP